MKRLEIFKTLQSLLGVTPELFHEPVLDEPETRIKANVKSGLLHTLKCENALMQHLHKNSRANLKKARKAQRKARRLSRI